MFVKSKEAKFYIVLEAKSLEEMRNLYGSSMATFHFARPDHICQVGKWICHNLRVLERDFCAWGIQTGPFAAFYTN